MSLAGQEREFLLDLLHAASITVAGCLGRLTIRVNWQGCYHTKIIETKTYQVLKYIFHYKYRAYQTV
jgi:hypothetical protein